MINNKILRSLEYVVVLLLFTGSVCLANPLHYGDPYRSNLQTPYEIREEAVNSFKEICPVWNSAIKEKIRGAYDDFLTCAREIAEDVQNYGDFGAYDTYGGMKQKTKLFCRVFSSLQPCIRNLLSGVKVCQPNASVDDAMSAYQEVQPILCNDGGRKLAEAAMEIAEENGRCLSKMTSELRSCREEVQQTYKNQTVAGCRMFTCLKNSFNLCGGAKKNTNEILDDLMALVKRRVGCTFNSSNTVFSTNPVLSFVALLISLFRSNFMHRETHL